MYPQVKQSNHANLAAAKIRTKCDSSGYTECVLDLIANRCSEVGLVVPTKAYINILNALCDLHRTNYSKNLERRLVKATQDSISCEGVSDCRKDAAISLTLAELLDKYESNGTFNPSTNTLCIALMKNLELMNVGCKPVSFGLSGLSSSSKSNDVQNVQNMNAALLAIGLIPGQLNDKQSKSVKTILESAKKQKAVGAPVDFKAALIDAGIRPNVENTLFMAYIAERAGLGSVWPVNPPYGPFHFGVFGNDASFGAEEEKKKPEKKPFDPENSITGSEAGDAILAAIVGAGVSLGVSYTNSQIALAAQESQLALARQYKDLYKTDPTPDQLNSYAANNPQQAAAAFATGAAAAGISQSDVDAAVAKALKDSSEKKDDKTLIYVGIGAGVLTLLGAAMIMSRR